MVAVTKAHELREAGHEDITITDDSEGLVQPLDWWSTIERTDEVRRPIG